MHKLISVNKLYSYFARHRIKKKRRNESRKHVMFFFNDTATTEIYTLSLHDALPICTPGASTAFLSLRARTARAIGLGRSEEHTSELQSHLNLVCRLLLEKKKCTGEESETNDVHPPRSTCLLSTR